jgi:hypothetical protein
VRSPRHGPSAPATGCGSRPTSRGSAWSCCTATSSASARSPTRSLLPASSPARSRSSRQRKGNRTTHDCSPPGAHGVSGAIILLRAVKASVVALPRSGNRSDDDDAAYATHADGPSAPLVEPRLRRVNRESTGAHQSPRAAPRRLRSITRRRQASRGSPTPPASTSNPRVGGSNPPRRVQQVASILPADECREERARACRAGPRTVSGGPLAGRRGRRRGGRPAVARSPLAPGLRRCPCSC